MIISSVLVHCSSVLQWLLFLYLGVLEQHMGFIFMYFSLN